MQPNETMAPFLSDVRRHVFRAGHPHLAAYMHDSLAMMEASSGRLDEARRHFRIGRELIERRPNAWLTQLSLANAFFIDFLDCRFADALEHLRKARDLGGSDTHHRPLLDCNEGHALLAMGRFAAAEMKLRRIVEGELPLFALGALEALARLYLVTDRLEDCERSLTQFANAVTDKPGAGKAFGGRWIAGTRLKLLMRRAKWQEAAEEARLYIENTRGPGDSLLRSTLLCLRVEALAGLPDVKGVGVALASAALATGADVPERHAAYYRAAAVVLRQEGDPLSKILFDRAKAIWISNNNECARIESERLFPEMNLPPLVVSADQDRSATNCVAAAFTLANSPRLLGRELLEAIRLLGCSPKSVVTDRGGATGDIEQSGSRVVLNLGIDQGRNLSLTCELPVQPSKVVALTDILQVGRCAVALAGYQREERNRAALWPADPIEDLNGSIFIADEMRALLAAGQRVAATNVPILITGETGTGKEVLARAIHAVSNRAKAPFLPFNCTSTPREMVDSQLFGHRRGAFTGATEHFPGVIRAAAGGTLFLDEIGDMSLEVQPKMLRFLESSEVHPIGETHPKAVDVRVIAATNVPLDALVTAGRFREDLFYRLNIVHLHIPPLRERRVEIPTIAHHYLQKYAREFKKGDLRLSEDTMEYLVLFRWPGNVRQLANETRRMAALAEAGAVLMPEHLSPEIAASRRTIPASQRTLEPTEVVVRLDQPLPAAIQHVERAMLQYALKKTGGRMEETASLLGLSRKGLYLKRQRFGIEPPGDGHIEVA